MLHIALYSDMEKNLKVEDPWLEYQAFQIFLKYSDSPMVVSKESVSLESFLRKSCFQIRP